MNRLNKGIILALTVATVGAANAQVNLNVKTTFGGGDGYLAPGDVTWLTTDSNQRSMAFNKATGNLLVVNGTGIRIVNGITGVSSTFMDVTGVTGGTRNLNAIGVTNDGVVYGVNLTTNTTSSPVKIYRWANDTNTTLSTVEYSGNGGLAGARLGDDFAVFGTDANRLMAGGYGTGFSGYGLFSGGSLTATGVTPVTGTNTGDYRLGIAFRNGGTIFGTQSAGGTGAGSFVRNTSLFGTLNGSIKLTSSSERGMAITVVGAKELLATIDTVSSLVRVYDITGLSSSSTALPTAATGSIVTTINANGNGTSALAFGNSIGNKVALYAMNTNNGIQAYDVALVPEPGTMAAIGLGVAALARRRRKASK